MKREPPESGGEEWQQSQTNSYVATWAAEAARMGQGQSAAAAGQGPEGGVSWNAQPQQQHDSSYQQAPAAAAAAAVGASNYASADPVNGRSRENSCERAAHQGRSSRSRSPSRGDPRVRVPADRRSHTPVSHSSPSQQSASGNSRLLSPSHGGTPGNGAGAMGMADRGASPASSQHRQVTANGHSRRSKSPQLFQAMSQDNAPPQGLDSGPGGGDPEGGILEDVSDISEDDNIPDAPAMAATESAQPDLTRGPEPKDEAMDTSGGGATGQLAYSIL